VLPSHAKLGQLGNQVVWAVICGKRRDLSEKQQPNSKKAKSDDPETMKPNRWVSGKIYVPVASGDVFQYAVTGFGTMEQEVQDATIVKHALSAYLETILLASVRQKLGWITRIKPKSFPIRCQSRAKK
jgi:hypothetical protein